MEKNLVMKNKAFLVEVKTEDDVIKEAKLIETLDKHFEKGGFVIETFKDRNVEVLRDWLKLMTPYTEEEK